MSYIMYALGWVLKLCNDLCGNYGVALILFTLLIKLVLLPLSVKQQSSMMKTQKLQPLLNEIQRKYPNDKEKQSQETMKLYQKYKVSPMSGCLPLLIQLPILFALFWVVKRPVTYMMGFAPDEFGRILTAIGDWGSGNQDAFEKFLSSMPNITSLEQLAENDYKMFQNYEIQIAQLMQRYPEILQHSQIVELGRDIHAINFNFLGMDLSETPALSALLGLFTGKTEGLTADVALLWIIPILSGVSALASSKLSQKLQPQQEQKVDENGDPVKNPMQTMLWIMPLISVWFAFTLPAAVGVYWIASNLIQMGQQVLLTKMIKLDDTEEQIEGELVDVKKNRKKRKK